MKNIEKFPRTNDALEAYNKSKSKNMPFEVWLELEYTEPSMQTLLEAAETVTSIWKSKPHECGLTNFLSAIANLSEAIEREKKKPIRNFDKYTLAEALRKYGFPTKSKHWGEKEWLDFCEWCLAIE